MVFLMPREEKFFDLFDEGAEILVNAAQKFLDMMRAYDRVSERSEELKEAEHACDLLVERIFRALDRSFVTPMDREDIHALATSLDNVLDNMEETAYRLETYRLERPTPEQVEIAEIVHESCERVATAIKLCRKMKDLHQLEIILREIGRLENKADGIYRHAEAKLFANPPDLLTLIKTHELDGWLEETVDACREVAQVISRIVVKGA